MFGVTRFQATMFGVRDCSFITGAGATVGRVKAVFYYSGEGHDVIFFLNWGGPSLFLKSFLSHI